MKNKKEKILRIFCKLEKGKKDLGFNKMFNILWFGIGSIITIVGCEGYGQGLGIKAGFVAFFGIFLLYIQMDWLSKNLSKIQMKGGKQK